MLLWAVEKAGMNPVRSKASRRQGSGEFLKPWGRSKLSVLCKMWVTSVENEVDARDWGPVPKYGCEGWVAGEFRKSGFLDNDEIDNGDSRRTTLHLRRPMYFLVLPPTIYMTSVWHHEVKHISNLLCSFLKLASYIGVILLQLVCQCWYSFSTKPHLVQISNAPFLSGSCPGSTARISLGFSCLDEVVKPSCFC